MQIVLTIPRLIIATHNLKKGGEMIQILGERFPGLELRTLADYPEAPEPEETGSTYAENAAIKSETSARVTREWSAADDAGLEIDALDGAPGMYSKRFGGEDMPFDEKIAKVLEMMNGVSTERRTARFRCCVALTEPKHMVTKVFEGICEGRIALDRRGSGGFGYDPIFFLPELGRQMAELTPEEKHAVSHRGKVLKLLGDFLEG